MTAHHRKLDFLQLLDIAIEALAMWPPDYVSAFFGSPSDWFRYNRYSETTMADLSHLQRAVRYLTDIGFPSFPAPPPSVVPKPVADLLWHPTRVLPPPKSDTRFPREQWFFINGILTNADLAHFNVSCLTHLFHRPITIIQNSTDGLVFDLVECALAKEWLRNTESATIAMPAIYKALKDGGKDRVVVVCHSQGTLIMAVVLRAFKALGQHWACRARNRERLPKDVARALGNSARPAGDPKAPRYDFKQEIPQLEPDRFAPLADDEWRKLEIYCFANCANEMRHHTRIAGRPVPWIESFGNEHDLVARLGMLAPKPAAEGIYIEGPKYVRYGGWGHLLNQCYLLPIAASRKPAALPFKLTNREEFPYAGTPRLAGYLGGGSP